MLQQLFLCPNCGTDTLTRTCAHQSPPIELYRCPICRQFKLLTEDPNDDRVDWVALGEVVCGRECHEKAYDLVRLTQHNLPFQTGDP